MQNKLPGKIDPILTDKTRATLETHEKCNGYKIYVRRLCMHCENAACASVCPVGAFDKTQLGTVIYHAEKCIGCRYCMVTNPFLVPKYQWDKTLPYVQKCILCYNKVKDGELLACTSACPTEVTLFSEREKLLSIVQMRLAKNPGKYLPQIGNSKRLAEQQFSCYPMSPLKIWIFKPISIKIPYHH